MNLRQTAEVAALAAIRADEIIGRPEPVSTESLHGYWKSSRVRLRCWFAGLRSTPASSEGDGTLSPHHLRERVGLARSILAAELLTRVWSTILVARDAARSENSAGEMVRNVFLGQQEARREVIQMLSDENRLPTPEAASVEQLRRRVERWTDLLLGPLVLKYDVTEFVFDEGCARGSVRSTAEQIFGKPAGAVDRLTLIGLSQAIPRDPSDDHVGSALDSAVAQTVLSALPRTPLEKQQRATRGTDSRRDDPSPLPAQPMMDASSSKAAAGLQFTQLRRRTDRRRSGPKQ